MAWRKMCRSRCSPHRPDRTAPGPCAWVIRWRSRAPTCIRSPSTPRNSPPSRASTACRGSRGSSSTGASMWRGRSPSLSSWRTSSRRRRVSGAAGRCPMGPRPGVDARLADSLQGPRRVEHRAEGTVEGSDEHEVHPALGAVVRVARSSLVPHSGRAGAPAAFRRSAPCRRCSRGYPRRLASAPTPVLALLSVWWRSATVRLSLTRRALSSRGLLRQHRRQHLAHFGHVGLPFRSCRPASRIPPPMRPLGLCPRAPVSAGRAEMGGRHRPKQAADRGAPSATAARARPVPACRSAGTPDPSAAATVPAGDSLRPARACTPAATTVR